MKKYKILLIMIFIICTIGFNCPKSIIMNYKSISVNNMLNLKGSNDKNIMKFNSVDNIDLSEVTYFISESIRDQRLDEAIDKAYNLEKGKHNIRYYFNRVQLNNDMEPETFVYFIGSELCGTGGCSAAIFSCKNGEYELLSKFTLVNNPILITNNFTNGYRDIIMFVSGGGIEDSYRIMKFDGSRYPENPSIQPKVKSGTKLIGPAIIADDVTKNLGIEL